MVSFKALMGMNTHTHTQDRASGFQLLYRIMTESVPEHLRELSFLPVRSVGERFDPGGTVITRSAAVHRRWRWQWLQEVVWVCPGVSGQGGSSRIVSSAHNAAIRHVLTGPDSWQWGNALLYPLLYNICYQLSVSSTVHTHLPPDEGVSCQFRN